MTQEEKKYPKGTIVHVVLKVGSLERTRVISLSEPLTGDELFDKIQDADGFVNKATITSLSIFQPTL